GAHWPRGQRIDPRARGGYADEIGMLPVTPGMQNLQQDLAAAGMDSLDNRPVLQIEIGVRVQKGTILLDQAGLVRRISASDDEGRAAMRAGSVESGKPLGRIFRA